VHVGATVTGDRLLVRICDEGCGMGPRLDSPGLGLGLPLIARSVDALDVHHGDAGGTEIRMAFSLSAFSTKSGR
jgi:anti-sigma regulatory factor (Ser/Thr protein kinase)